MGLPFAGVIPPIRAFSGCMFIMRIRARWAPSEFGSTSPGTLPGAEDNTYHPNGSAKVRNVELPVTYNHVTVPDTARLARDEKTRDWINAYVPGSTADPSDLPGDASLHVLWAADVWYSVKKHWCLEVQRLIRARRG